MNDSAGPESAAGERGSAMPSASMLPLQTPLEGIKEVKPSGGKAGRSPDVKEKKKHFFGDGDVGGVEGAIKPKPFSGAPARKKDKSKTAEAACAQLSADSIGSAGKSKGKGSNKAPKRQPAVKGHPDAEIISKVARDTQYQVSNMMTNRSYIDYFDRQYNYNVLKDSIEVKKYENKERNKDRRRSIKIIQRNDTNLTLPETGMQRRLIRYKNVNF